jgi:two-component system response regulator RstA
MPRSAKMYVSGLNPRLFARMLDHSPSRILLVEDDQELALMIADYLTPYGFEICVEGRGDRAVERIRAETFEAVLLDVNLPGLDGLIVCRTIRPMFPGPILILTARGDEVDEVVGLEVGADDYLAKPVRPRVLLARLRAQLRKRSPAGGEHSKNCIALGTLTVDAGRRTVIVHGQEVKLTSAEFDLLWLLAEHAGQVIKRSEIYQRIHGVDYDGLDRSIDLRISRLRKKLGDDPDNPQRIKSVRSVGYLLSELQ